MRLILIRHGETEANANKIYSGWSNYPFTERGCIQIECLKNIIAHENIDYIYSSSTDRALHTAQTIADAIGKDVISDDNLKEINFGIFDGKTADEIRKEYEIEWNSWNEDYVNYRIPDGESLADVSRRIKYFIDRLLDDKSYLVVSHGGTIRAIITNLLKLKLENIWCFKIPPGTIVEIEYTNGFGFISKLNPIE